jgi:ATP-dependent RNA helicase DDX52/ROK1
LIASPLKFGHICESFPSIDCLEALVIDEADKMFEMGFLEQVDQILCNLPNQTKVAKFMFSATMQPAIQELVRKVMIDPLKVQIGVMNTTASAVKQNIVYVGKEDAKLMTLR